MYNDLLRLLLEKFLRKERDFLLSEVMVMQNHLALLEEVVDDRIGDSGAIHWVYWQVNYIFIG